MRKEALLTSQIEGTQPTLVDLFDDEAGIAVSNADDVEEVTNDLRAFRHVRDALQDPQGLPISVRLLCQAHALLLDGVRGTSKQPGELRKSQNWIGGTRPGNAVFVPPPADRVAGLLGVLERFIHDEAPTLPPLGIAFFLKGVEIASLQAERGIVALASLVASDRRRLLDAPKAGSASYRLFELLPTMPRFTIERVCQQLGTSTCSANERHRMRCCFRKARAPSTWFERVAVDPVQRTPSTARATSANPAPRSPRVT